MNAIENLIENMVENHIYSKVLHIKDLQKKELFLMDVGPYIENKKVRIKEYQNHIKFYLGFESLKRIGL